jgi:hypothetical protein
MSEQKHIEQLCTAFSELTGIPLDGNGNPTPPFRALMGLTLFLKEVHRHDGRFAFEVHTRDGRVSEYLCRDEKTNRLFGNVAFRPDGSTIGET